MRFSTLSDWLSWQETLHPNEIELGLPRVQSVWQAMQPNPLSIPVISVAGTNGKGSSIALLQSIYLAAGYRVGSYTSPHLYRYNERICIDGVEVDDGPLIQAFEQIDKTRGETSLTYFEFGTLAALSIFASTLQSDKSLDVILLEVGLGGRLDAVNIIDADLALITSIDLDHQDWLGDSKEQIGKEKAGIFRENKYCVINDPDAPASVEAYALQCGCVRYMAGREFGFSATAAQWDWYGVDRQRSDKRINKTALPRPALTGQHQLQNACGVLMAVQALNEVLPVSQQAIREGLMNVKLAGRFELRASEVTSEVTRDVTTILDVAHNPAAAQLLATTLSDYLKAHRCGGQLRCLFSIMADKDMVGVLEPMMRLCQQWNIAPLAHSRSAEVASIHNEINKLNPENQVVVHDSVTQAYHHLVANSDPGDMIVVFGSFYTVAEAGAITV